MCARCVRTLHGMRGRRKCVPCMACAPCVCQEQQGLLLSETAGLVAVRNRMPCCCQESHALLLSGTAWLTALTLLQCNFSAIPQTHMRAPVTGCMGISVSPTLSRACTCCPLYALLHGRFGVHTQLNFTQMCSLPHPMDSQVQDRNSWAAHTTLLKPCVRPSRPVSYVSQCQRAH